MTVSSEAMTTLRESIAAENEEDNRDEFEYDGTVDDDNEYYDGEPSSDDDSDNDESDNTGDNNDTENNSNSDDDDSSSRDNDDDNNESDSNSSSDDNSDDSSSDDDTSDNDGEKQEKKDSSVDDKQTKNRTQQRIDTLISQREDARARVKELEDYYRRREEVHVDEDGNEVDNPNKLIEPDEDDFEDYESYNKEFVAYSASKAVQDNQDAQLRADYDANVNKEADIVIQQFNERSIEARNNHDDFESVVGNPELQITPSMVYVMADSEIGGEIAYYLGKNPEESARLSTMPESLMGRAISVIEAKLSKPINKTVNKPAPTTGRKATRSGSNGTKSAEKMSTAEYIANRRKSM